MPSPELHAALIAGPQYDRLLDELSEFERRTGYQIQVDVRLPHVELNARMAEDLGTDRGRYDLISTHTKYSPSQAAHLRPLDDLLGPSELADFLPRALDLCRIGSRLMQLPRNFDARLLFYRSDLVDAPRTWDEAAAQMVRHTGPGLYGFAFPGRQSGLFGTFYELLGMAGGELFDENLRPTFNSEAGEWALAFLHRLHMVDRVTPPDLLDRWYYDEVSEGFRRGRVLMVGDWPGYYGLYTDSRTCAVVDRFDVAVYPAGPAGLRRAYAGCHTFAIPTAARNLEGALALLRYLTSADVQYREAMASGHTPVRRSVFERVRSAVAPGSRDARRLAALQETVESYAMIPPRFARYPLVEEILWVGIQRAVAGIQTPREALRSMERQVREALA
ncbi:MAG: extracellular solute-binding protein [Armatimonadota bacterium]|nr:extracellular solute-binding protein [Armatimonadota bacterium]MDR7574477.1 extracellular solute-binding protein [Armatimonadota bacterium]